MTAALVTNDVAPVLAALRERGIAIDPHFSVECRQLFGNAGIRARYCRKGGLRIDDVSELLWDRGFTLDRLDCRGVLELLEEILQPRGAAPKRARVPSVRQADAMERKARTMRNRKYSCPRCEQNVRGTRNTTVLCGLCYEMHGEIIPMVRIDPLPEEIAMQAAGEMERAR